MLLERLRATGDASANAGGFAVDRLPPLLDRIGVAHGVTAARSAAARGEPVLLLATWSRYGLTVLDELIAAGGPLPAVLDMAVFTSPEDCRAAWPEVCDVKTLPVALLPGGRRVAGMTGVREALTEWQASAGPAAPLGARVSPADPRPAPAVSPAL